jgi:NDP-sugar pyrophosphorylase family protein
MTAPARKSPVGQAAVLCGGKGTRLAPVTGEGVPKVMVDVCGRPLIDYHLDLLRRHGVADVVLCTGHLSGAVEAHVHDGSAFGLRVRYTREPRPLGTAGALVQAAEAWAERLFVLYGDVLADVDLARMAAFHLANGGEATLLVHPSDHPHDSDLVRADPATGRITAFPGRPQPGEEFVNLTSAGLYVIERGLLDHVPRDRPSDFGRDVFPARLAAGADLYACDTGEYARDLGTPDRYARVCDDVRRSRDHRAGRLPGP